MPSHLIIWPCVYWYKVCNVFTLMVVDCSGRSPAEGGCIDGLPSSRYVHHVRSVPLRTVGIGFPPTSLPGFQAHSSCSQLLTSGVVSTAARASRATVICSSSFSASSWTRTYCGIGGRWLVERYLPRRLSWSWLVVFVGVDALLLEMGSAAAVAPVLS